MCAAHDLTLYMISQRRRFIKIKIPSLCVFAIKIKGVFSNACILGKTVL